jgi:hypothetical protein
MLSVVRVHRACYSQRFDRFFQSFIAEQNNMSYFFSDVGPIQARLLLGGQAKTPYRISATSYILGQL